MKERPLDRYLRREDTVLAKTLKRISPESGEQWRNSKKKKVMETTVAAPLAAASVPVVAGLAVAKKCEDGGSAFFVQERRSSEGTIPIVKIRTMKDGSDEDAREALELTAKHDPDKDPRNTPLGAIIRKLDLDELPQLLQVLKGDMSLVGIRAAPDYVFEHLQEERPKNYQGWRESYYEGRPGILNLKSAVNDDTGKDNRRRVHYDQLYARKASLGLDLYIIYRTSLKMIKNFFRR